MVQPSLRSRLAPNIEIALYTMLRLYSHDVLAYFKEQYYSPPIARGEDCVEIGK